MKKFLSMLLAVAMLLTVCAFSVAETTGFDGEIKVWVADAAVEFTKAQIDAFKAANAEYANMTVTVEPMGEGDAATAMITDVESGADIYGFAQDQLSRLVAAGALEEVAPDNVPLVTAENDAGSVAAATLGDVMYAYPLTSDNGYFLYYDKSVFTEDDLKTLDGILAAANAAGKKVHMDVSNGWYLASFFLGNGCTLTIEDGKQVMDFNNEKGLAAAEAIREFCNDPAFVTGDDSVLSGGIGDSIACGVSGTWVSTAIQEKLGENYGCCKLPTFTCAGKQVQMGSFLGCKIYGVNSQTAYPVDAMELAEFLTSEQSQLERYEELNYGPSNVNALASDAVSSNLALRALGEQSNYAVTQLVLGGFWVPAEAFGAELEAHTTADLQTLLDQLVEQATAG